MSSLRKIVTRVGFCGLGLALVGCAADRPADVPAGAESEVEGGQRLVYSAPSNGRIWVSDVGSNSVIYAGSVHQGDEVAVDPDNNRVTIGGQIVTTHDIGHVDHRVFFEAGMTELSGGAPDLGSRNVDRPPDVPASALLKGEGAQRVQYTSDAPGTIWVVDSAHNNVIYSSRVAQGDVIVVDPDKNNLTINGNKVYDQQLGNMSRRIFFMASTDTARPM